VRSYRFVFTPKWLAFHALTWLILIPAFIGLGQWQRGLWKDRDASQGVVLRALAAKPAPLDSADPAGHFVAQAQQWTMLTATGRYDTSHQAMVRNRSQNGEPGWYVVTPLVLADGTAVLVNQGWVAESQTGGPTEHPPFPPVPSGTVTVTGSLQPDETTADTRIKDDTADLPSDEIALISKTDVASETSYALRDGSLRLTASTPANTSQEAASPIPNPTYDNSMYIAYMIQWWVFAIVMPVTWFLLIRREAGDRALAEAEAAKAQSAAGNADGAGADAGSVGAGSGVGAGAGSGGAEAVEQGGEALGGEQLESLPDAVRG
jgi:cytochrome oxidase assembly protein ShyY1